MTRITLLLFLIISANIAVANSVDWERFRDRFISGDGRIIDTGNNHISHSEGQGLGMLFAVAYDDRETFEKILQWTNENLGLRDDGLFVWRWMPNQENHYHDLGSASDGDVLIAWALARAAKKWNDSDYLEIAKSMAQTIRKELVAEIYGDTVLLPGPIWPRRDGYTVINLSYWIFPAFQELSEIDASPQWEKLIRTGIDLIKRARFGKWDLPADWFALASDGTLSQLDDFSFVFGYESVRIPLYYLWGGYTDRDILRVFQAFWSSTARGEKLVTILGLAMDSVIQQENVLAYRAVNELIDCAITREPASILDESFADHHDYYSASVFLIAQLVAEERMPYCLEGGDKEEIREICDGEEDPRCPLSDPIHAKIEKGNIVVRVEDMVQMPPTRTRRPLARIGQLTHANDDSNRLFAVDEDGKIHIIKDGELVREPFIDLASELGSDFYAENPETGVKSIAFHPDFANPGNPGYQYLYTVHTENRESKSPTEGMQIFMGSSTSLSHYDVISEWRVDPENPDRVIPESQRELLRIGQPGRFNNAEYIGFNPLAEISDPDYGLLYIGVGDGSGMNGNSISNDEEDFDEDRKNKNTRSQSGQTVLGKILRIDPMPGKEITGYNIPADNPFVENNNILPEIWAYGLHNPWQFSWDIDGKMYIVDAGWQNIEEVNQGIAGANYGWNHREGTFAVNYGDPKAFPLPANDEVWGFTYPIVQYDRDEGNAITGGFVYRGDLIPELNGYYIFGDTVNGRIFYVDTRDMPVNKADMAPDVSNKIKELRLFYKGAEKNLLEILNYDSRADLSLGQDEDGELYLLTKRDGMIRKILPLPENVR